MALFTPGIAVGQISGRVGGQVFSHNRGGMYIRTGSTPTNPMSPAQTLIRGFTVFNATAWKNLGDALQASWNAWAQSASEAGYLSRVGLANQLNGQQAYIRLNNRLLYANLTRTDVPPPQNIPDGLSASALIATNAGGILTFTGSVTPGTPATGTAHQIGVTTSFGSGTSTFRQNQLRLVYTSAVDTAIDLPTLTANYVARYGNPPSGSKLGFGARAILEDSGAISPWLLQAIATIL